MLYEKVKEKRMLEGKETNGDVSIIFVDKEHMNKLNLEYRKKDKPTDVLTFVLNKDIFEGEIYICTSVCSDENIEKWILDRVIHGFLHMDDCHHSTKEEETINEKRHNALLQEIN
tara:strand:+ start:3451 stop:3795 length:345 start_codon:yes stop_codon:yes gene_type:complete